MNKNIKISKLDAAKRQLETAIRLYFNDADPVSIHTLAAAAHGILADINKHNNGHPMLVSDFLVKTEYKKEIRRKMSEAKNHFKHADQNPEAVIDFNPDVNETYIFDAGTKYHELTGESVLYFKIFNAWFASGRPQAFLNGSEYTEIRQRFRNKADYYSKMLSISNVLL